MVSSIAWSAVAGAGAPQPFSDDLTLDWDGFRSNLLDKGVDFRIGYVSETASNVRGGDKELVRYTDQITFAATFDLQKLLRLPQAQLKIAITDRNGDNLSSDAHLASLQQVQELYGRGQTWRWTQFWYDQKYFDGMLDWKIGRLTEGEDFAAFSCNFMNLTFCGAPPGNIVGNYWYNWPVAQWGTRLKASFDGLGYVQLGAFEVNPRYLETRNAFNLGEPGGATGVLAPFEIGWLPVFGGAFEGSYKFGVWYNSAKAPDVVENTQGRPLAIDGGDPLMHSSQHGAYVNFLQRVGPPRVAGSKRGVSFFFNATYADRRTSTLDSQITGGAFYTGPFGSRPDDKIGIAIGRTHVNSRITAVESAQNTSQPRLVGVQTSEYVGEVLYSLQAAKWLELRPNVQYVRQPGGVSQNANDVILGLKLSVNF